MEHFPARRLEPYRVWIGSERDSRDQEAMRALGVGLIVNCTRDLPFRVHGPRHFRVPVHDSPDEARTMAQHLPRAVALIDDAARRGEAVLVHCWAGVSRSASVAAAFLMHREGLTPRQAMARVKALKPETFEPRPNFARALADFARSREQSFP